MAKFFNSIEDKIIRKEDRSHGMVRVEIVCANVNLISVMSLMMVLLTGERYCVNSLSPFVLVLMNKIYVDSECSMCSQYGTWISSKQKNIKLSTQSQLSSNEIQMDINF